jgi:FkbH-like protein
MPSEGDHVERALRATTRQDVLDALRGLRRSLTLPEVTRLGRHASGFTEPLQPLRVGVVRNYTTELLRPYWTLETLLQGFALDFHEAPYGGLLSETEAGSGLLRHEPDLTYFFLRWEEIDPRLAEPLARRLHAGDDALLTEVVERLGALLEPFRRVLAGAMVVTMLPRFGGPELGVHDAMAAQSERSFRERLKTRLSARLRDSLPGVYFDDLDTVMERVGRSQMFDPRLWHTSRFPFSVAGAQAVVRRLVSYAVLLKHPRVKCIVLDADNTLWGGVVGEDGIDGIALGPDYPGSAYVAFQHRLLELQQRGLLLALCSKNNEADVLEVLRDHPHQLIRESHLAAVRINWLPKPENLVALAGELNLGLEAFVLVDDSAHECLAVRRELSQVLVVQTPVEPSEVPLCLDDLPQLETLTLTAEDRGRTALYAQERQRRTLATGSGDFEQYLQSLDMTMTVGVDDPHAIARIAQLTQKTNQFNVTTRRYGEGDIRRFIGADEWTVFHFSLADVFGDSGIVGVALVQRLGPDTAAIDSFLMSCRVIGRRAERAFLAHVLQEVARRGVATIRASFVPTAKNALVATFWADAGFRTAAPDTYELDLTNAESWGHLKAPIRVQTGGASDQVP